MDMYQAIFERRSIRKYSEEKMDSQLREKVETFIANVQPLFSEAEYEIRILGADEVKGMLSVEAPHYLVYYGKKDKMQDLNGGFVLEQIVLYLTRKCLGTCYLGMTKPIEIPKELKERDLKPRMVVAFGYSEEEDVETIKRKREKLGHIARFKEEVDDWMRGILEAARIAPSAVNNQPWCFVVYRNRIHVFRRISKIPLLKEMDVLSVGIALAHIMVAAEEKWMIPEFSVKPAIQDKSFKYNEYLITAEFTEAEEEA